MLRMEGVEWGLGPLRGICGGEKEERTLSNNN